jgi:hypothetical protein
MNIGQDNARRQKGKMGKMAGRRLNRSNVLNKLNGENGIVTLALFRVSGRPCRRRWSSVAKNFTVSLPGRGAMVGFSWIWFDWLGLAFALRGSMNKPAVQKLSLKAFEML